LFAHRALNLLITHSGWDVWWGPDPREHFLHHNGGKRGAESNLGIFLDGLCGTSWKPPPEGQPGSTVLLRVGDFSSARWRQRY
jgi:sterol desaturase/sphingolipid hydroxylase (fatty acid hydroxylase superfamily)